MSIYLIAYIGHDASTVYIDRVQVPLSVNLLILGYVYIEDNGVWSYHVRDMSKTMYLMF